MTQVTVTEERKQVNVTEEEVSVISAGTQGPAGPGMPVGGNERQWLMKNGPDNFDTIWASITTDDITGLATALAGKSNVGHTHVSSAITDLSSAVDARIDAQKGQADGVASLGSDGKIPSSQLNPLAITSTNVVASQSAQLALDAQEGDVAVRTDLNKSFIHNGGVAGTMADWTELLTPTDAVLSVNGMTGAVVLTASTVGAQVQDPILDSLSALSTTGTGFLGYRSSDGASFRRTITGTTNQVVVTNGSGQDGNPTLSLPQDIAISSVPQFGGLITAYIAPSSDSGTAFQIRKANQSTSLMSFDTTNNRVGILTTAPTHTVTHGSNSTGIVLYNTSDQTSVWERLNLINSGNVSYVHTSANVAGGATMRALRLGASDGTGLPSNYMEFNRLSANGLMNLVVGSYGGLAQFTVTGTQTGTATAQYTVRIMPTISGGGTNSNTDLLINRTETAVGSGAQYLFDGQVGGVSKFSITNAGKATIAGDVTMLNTTTAPKFRVYHTDGVNFLEFKADGSWGRISTNTAIGTVYTSKKFQLDIAEDVIFNVPLVRLTGSVADANLVLGTTSGTKIGTATTQKLGFWNKTPVVQQVLATGAGAAVDDVISLLQTLGLCKQS